jgi:hypothetical protein
MAGCAKSIAPELSDSFSTKVGDQVVTSQGSGVLLDLDRSKARPFYLLLETGKKKWFRKRDVTKPHDGVQIEVSMLKLVGKYVWYRSKEVWARAKVHSVRGDGCIALEKLGFAELLRSGRREFVHVSLLKTKRSRKDWVTACCRDASARRWGNRYGSGERCSTCGSRIAHWTTLSLRMSCTQQASSLVMQDEFSSLLLFTTCRQEQRDETSLLITLKLSPNDAVPRVPQPDIKGVRTHAYRIVGGGCVV